VGSLQKAISGALPAPFGDTADRLGVVARAATMPKAAHKLLRPELAPLTASLLSVQTRLASIPALAHVTQRLGVDAEFVVFGHVHRLGPVQVTTIRIGGVRAGDRGSSIPGHGSTSRCSCTGPPRRITTGRAARSSSTTTETLSRWDFSTPSRRTRCADRAMRLLGRCDNSDLMPRHWLAMQVLIVLFVLAGMVIAITKLA
jgi:hypothetical protein